MSLETEDTPEQIRERYGLADETWFDRVKRDWVGYLFVAPTLLGFVVLFYLPLLRGGMLMFYDVTIAGEDAFVGFKNIMWMFNHPDFLYFILWTLAFAFGTLLISAPLGLFTALVLNEVHNRWRKFIAPVIISPYFAAPLATGVIWFWFLHADFGPFGLAARALGVNEIHFLNDGLWPNISIIAARAWHLYGYAAIIYLAALTQIPRERYEAAAIDGATRLKRFKDVTIPHLKTPTIIVFSIETAWNIAEFATPFEMTAGGPGTQTTLLSIVTYKTTYVNRSFGRGAAFGMLMLVIATIIAVVYIRTITQEEELHV